MTILRDVSHQLVSNWKGKIIAYEVQKAARVSIEFLKMKRSTMTETLKAAIAISE
jgi:hypothetical protein